MNSKTFTARIMGDDDTTMTGFEVPFDPKSAFGKVRAPVRVSINKHSYRSTICAMGGKYWVPLRKSNRDPAGVKAGDRVKITLEFDDQPRIVTPPKDLAKALREANLLDVFKSYSYTHQHEHVEAIEQAKMPETRERRIKACVDMVRSKQSAPAKRAAKAGQIAKAKRPSASKSTLKAR